MERWLRVAVDDLVHDGRLDRGVEFVHSWGLGLPSGTAAAVERAYADLVDQDVLLIVGPAIGDNALVATPLAERYGVPTINWAGTERARSTFMFHLQVGSHEDESIVLARWLSSIGARRVGLDSGPVTDRAQVRAVPSGRSRRAGPTDRHGRFRRPAGRRRRRTGRAGARRRSRLARLSRARPRRPGRGESAECPRLGRAPGDEHGRDARLQPRVRAGPSTAGSTSTWSPTATRPLLRSAPSSSPGLSPTTGYGAARGYDLSRLVAEGLARAAGENARGGQGRA